MQTFNLSYKTWTLVVMATEIHHRQTHLLLEVEEPRLVILMMVVAMMTVITLDVLDEHLITTHVDLVTTVHLVPLLRLHHDLQPSTQLHLKNLISM